MKFKYLFNCVQASRKEVQLLELLLATPRSVSYSYMVKKLGLSILQNLFAFYNWEKHSRAPLKMKDDYHVRYYKKVVNGCTYLYIVHSSIEYVFQEIKEEKK
jgi:hypothetical protein